MGFKVEFAPKAWKQVGTLQLEGFDRVRAAINSVAAAQTAEAPAGTGFVSAGRLVVLYDVVPEERTVRVTQVTQPLPEVE